MRTQKERAHGTLYIIDFKTDIKLCDAYFWILKAQSHKQRISTNTRDSNLQCIFLLPKADNFVFVKA
jgi:hypothetical protein